MNGQSMPFFWKRNEFCFQGRLVPLSAVSRSPMPWDYEDAAPSGLLMAFRFHNSERKKLKISKTGFY